MSDEEYIAEHRALWRNDADECLKITQEARDGWDEVYFCGRPRHHSGPHVCCTSKAVYLRWSTDYMPLPNLLLP